MPSSAMAAGRNGCTPAGRRMAGLIAAQLARSGIPRPAPGARSSVSGCTARSLATPDVDPDVLGDGLGPVWRGAGARQALSLRARDRALYRRRSGAARGGGRCSRNRASIECVMAPWAMPIVGEPRDTKIAPRNDLEAIASLPFMLAAALGRRPCRSRQRLPATIAIRNAEIWRWPIASLAKPILRSAPASTAAWRLSVRDGRTPLPRRVALAPAERGSRSLPSSAPTPRTCRQAAMTTRLLRALLDEMPRCRAIDAPCDRSYRGAGWRRTLALDAFRPPPKLG